jgi:hypothetical protein
MNERIKQLAEHAKDFMTDEVSYLSSIHNRALSTTEAADIFEEKFAQLIVRECMLQCDIPESGNTPLSKDFNEGHIMGVYECFHKIKNHFGVEE